MADAIRDEYVIKLNAARQKMKTAGSCHKRDLARSIKCMNKELIIYDKYHKQAVMNSG